MASSIAVDIDGSLGEGGGQIVRSALALSLVTGKPCSMVDIRAGRKKPGLLRQHLTAVHAAAEVGSATVAGAALGSRALRFHPGRVRGGSYRFAVGTAGSATLVLQTVLPALLLAREPSAIELEGGTHNPFAPPFDFLDRVLLPLLCAMGPRIRAELERPGFYPAGGGRFRVRIEPVARLARIDLLERGQIRAKRALARVAGLSPRIAERELAVVRESLGWEADCLRSERVTDAVGPGNVLTLEIESENVTELFTGFGRRGVPAERVAASAVREVRDYVSCPAAVGPYLADQLLVPLALGSGGRFRTVRPTAHTLTNREIVRRFVDARIAIERSHGASWIVVVDPPRHG